MIIERIIAETEMYFTPGCKTVHDLPPFAEENSEEKSHGGVLERKLCTPYHSQEYSSNNGTRID